MFLWSFRKKLIKAIVKAFKEKDYGARFSMAVGGICLMVIYLLIQIWFSVKVFSAFRIEIVFGLIVTGLLIFDAVRLSKLKANSGDINRKEEDFLRSLAIANGLDPITFNKIESKSTESSDISSAPVEIVDNHITENTVASDTVADNANIEKADYIQNESSPFSQSSDTIKVVLLGDSIRLQGYGPLVPDLLGDKYEIWQPEQNGKYVSNVLRQIFDYYDEIKKADIIHFNSGEWDVCDLFGDGAFTPEDFYVSQIKRIVKILLSMGKKVIFATTTPVRKENKYQNNAVIERYNEIILSELMLENVKINDLYSAISDDIYGNISEDCIHLSEKGKKICAGATARIIKSIII